MNENINEKNIKVFSENTGRTLIGEFVEQDDSFTRIRNPQIVNAQQIKDPQTGQDRMAINFIPYTYLELFDPESEDVWSFPSTQIVVSETTVSEQSASLYGKVVEAYKNMRAKMSAEQASEEESDNVIKFVD